jgi:hypothetical protein
VRTPRQRQPERSQKNALTVRSVRMPISQHAAEGCVVKRWNA